MAKQDFSEKLQARVGQFLDRWIQGGRQGREKAERDLYVLMAAAAAEVAENQPERTKPAPAKKAEPKAPRENKTTSANVQLKVTNNDSEG